MHQAPEGLEALGHGRERPWECWVRAGAALVVATLGVCSACEPELVVGTWSAGGESGGDAGGEAGGGGGGGQSGEGAGASDGACTEDAASDASTMNPLSVPWSTSFENGFCDFREVAGYCFADGVGSYETVESPVRSGKYAAAFTINSTFGYQARCVAQGELPEEAYYGAWYYVPSLTTNNSVWNLLHFQGGDPSSPHGLWDVSLRNGSDGSLEVFVFDFLRMQDRLAAEPRPIPIGAWFHLEFYFRRAADETGAIALYQDGELLVEASDLVTDDTEWGQWFVGNIANALSPAESTVYVDDITIGTSR
jgi:hypothetical protein